MTDEKQEWIFEFKFKLFISLFCIILFIGTVIFITYSSIKKTEEYPRIYPDESLSAIVNSVQWEKSYKYLTPQGGIKRTIYSPKDLVDFIRSGDKLVKRSQSDSLFVIRNNEVYRFRLDY